MSKITNFFGDIQKTKFFFESHFKATLGCVHPAPDNSFIITGSPNNLLRLDDFQETNKQVYEFDDLNKLILPAVAWNRCQNPKEKSDIVVVGVHTGNVLRLWSKNDQNETQSEIVEKIVGKVITLLPTRTPLLIFEDGKTCFINKLGLDSQNDSSCIAKNEQIVSIHFHEYRNTLSVYFIVKEKGVESSPQIFCKRFDPKIDSVRVSARATLPQNFVTCAKNSRGIQLISQKKDQVTLHKVNQNGSNSELTLEESEKFFVVGKKRIVSARFNIPNGELILLLKGEKKCHFLQSYDTRSMHVMLSELSIPEGNIQEFSLVNNHVVIGMKNLLMIVPILDEKVPISRLLQMSLPQNLPNMEIDSVGNDLSILENNIKSHLAKETLPSERFLVHNMLLLLPKLKSDSRNVFSIMDILLSVPFNPLFLRAELRKAALTLDSTISLIDALLNFDGFQSTQTARWLNALIDVNMVNFSINRNDEIVRRIKDIRVFTNKSLELYQNMQQFSTVVESFKNRKHGNNNEFLGVLSNVRSGDPFSGGAREDYRVDRICFG